MSFNWTVGTKYRTRGGGWAKVVAVVSESTVPVIVMHTGEVRTRSHHLNGKLCLRDIDNYDLLPEEWVEPAPPKELVQRYRYRIKDSDGDIWDSMIWFRSEKECLEYHTEAQILKQIDEDEFDE
jgi:hypothetical protein